MAGFFDDNRTQIEDIKKAWDKLILEFSPGTAAQKVNGQDSFICPLCGHGSGGDGVTFIPGTNLLKCFSCDFDGRKAMDIIDLCSLVTGRDKIDAVKYLASRLNITLENGAEKDFSYKPNKSITQGEKTAQNGNMQAEKAYKDYTEYFASCMDKIEYPAAVAYLTSRGFTMENIKRCGIGFDAAADPAGCGFKEPRIIIPLGRNSYTARSINPNCEKINRYKFPKGSSIGIFNQGILFNKKRSVTEIFICEGTLDAVAIMERDGAEAIAINGATNADRFIKTLEKREIKNIDFIIAAQKDEAAARSAKILREGLLRLNLSYISADLCGEFKDPAEYLQKNRAGFLAEVDAAIHKLNKPDNMEQYLQRDMKQDIADYKTNIHTGYKNLDDMMRFLYPGLYVLMAGSGIGKTTFLLQMACQIAEQGKDVLFFSLEQSRLELTAKSLARIVAGKNIETYLKAADIMNDEIPFKEKLALEAARDTFLNTVADRLAIVEGNFRCDMDFISEYVRKYIRRNGVTPVIFIDYLQILQPSAEAEKRRSTTKESVDSVVTDLKRFSREIKTPILAAASINRAAYFSPLEMGSSKESGNIEFTADCVMGLELRVMARPNFYDLNIIERSSAISAAKKERPRKVNFVCKKNRYGAGEFTCYFDYYSRNDLFRGISDRAEIAKIEREELAAGMSEKRHREAKSSAAKAADVYADPNVLPTWGQLTARKQANIFNLFKGRLLDEQMQEIELTYTTSSGRKYPAYKQGGITRDFTEDEYNAVLSFNKNHLPLYIKQQQGEYVESEYDDFADDPEQ